MMENKYIRLTKGVIDRGTLISIEEDIQKFIDEDSDYYASPYQYDETQYERFKQQGGSVAGIRNVTTDSLWWDFDNAENPEVARQDALTLVDRLIGHGLSEDNINVYFSGRKGFEVSVKGKNTLTPREVNSICTALADSLTTFDDSLYDSNQIFRIPGTKHQESGLYKTQMKVQDLRDHSFEEIKTFAQTKYPIRPKKPTDIPESILSLTPATPEPVKVNQTIDIADKPKWMCPTKWAIQQGRYEPKEGNEARMILAATYRAQGFDAEMTRQLVTLAEERRAERIQTSVIEPDELDRTVISVVYSPTWQGGQYSVHSNSLLKKIAEREGITVDESVASKLIQISDVAGDFKHFAKNIEQNRITTGIPDLDEKLIITTGMPWGIIGAPGSSKTSIAINMLRHNSEQGILCVFASIDISKRRLYEKLALNHLSRHYGRQDLYEFYKTDSKIAKDIDAKIKKEFENVYLFAQTSPNVVELKKYILSVEQATGKKVKFVVIDYFERISSDYQDDTASSKRVAGELQDLAIDTDVSLLTLFQPNKLSGDPSEPIRSYLNVKGSSFIQQSLRMILSIYREGFSPENSNNDKFLTINCLKDDLGGLFSKDYSWDGRTGTVGKLDPAMRRELTTLRENKKEPLPGGFGGGL